MTHRTRTVLWLLALWALIALALLLTGCAKPGDTKPEPPKVVEVIVTKYVPVPSSLTADCQNTEPVSQTYSEAKRLALMRLEFLEECTARMRRIRAIAK